MYKYKCHFSRKLHEYEFRILSFDCNLFQALMLFKITRILYYYQTKVKLNYETVEIRYVWFRKVQQRGRVTKLMKFGWRKYPRDVLKRIKICQLYKKECNIDDCWFIDARSLLFLKPEYKVGQKPLGTTGTRLIELYWHSAYIYWLSEKFKASFFSTDILHNSSWQACIFCPSVS
jgi:hypothetical protein